MQHCFLRVKKLSEGAKLPCYGSEHAAAADLFCLTDEDEILIAPETTVFVHTGIAMEIPEGCVGLIYARSGLGTKQGLAPANKVGVIDSDYRGEIIVALHNHSGEDRRIYNGDRIAQYIHADFEEADELSSTSRGEGGFGSTGK